MVRLQRTSTIGLRPFMRNCWQRCMAAMERDPDSSQGIAPDERDARQRWEGDRDCANHMMRVWPTGWRFGAENRLLRTAVVKQGLIPGSRSADRWREPGKVG